MARSLPEEVTQGTLEGDIAPGNITFFRLQSWLTVSSEPILHRERFSCCNLFLLVPLVYLQFLEMGRFYRHVLIEKEFPHHGAVAFGNHGKALFEVFGILGFLLRKSVITSLRE